MDVLIVFLSLVVVPCAVYGQNSTETPTMSPAGPCPPEWISYSTSCYLLSTTTADYNTSQTTCEDDCGYLVSLNDDDEYDFVTTSYSSMSGIFWTGLWRTCTSCPTDATTHWTWQDRTELNISKWFAGNNEPTGNSQCGLYISGGLSDYPCSELQAFVCERPTFCPTTTTIIETTVTSTVLPTADSGGTSTVDDGEKPIPVRIIVGVVVAIVVVGICVCIIAKCICHKKIACICCKKKRKPRIPETPSKSEEPKNVDPCPPPSGVKYRPNYESVVLENEDKGKTNNGFEKGPPDGTQAHGGSGEQGKPVERPTDVYAEVRKKDSANGAEMFIVENTLYGAGDFKDQ